MIIIRIADGESERASIKKKKNTRAFLLFVVDAPSTSNIYEFCFYIIILFYCYFFNLDGWGDGGGGRGRRWRGGRVDVPFLLIQSVLRIFFLLSFCFSLLVARSLQYYTELLVRRPLRSNDVYLAIMLG